MRIYSRAEWGARHRAGFGARRVGSLDKWLHHSVTASPGEGATFEQDAHTIRILEDIGQSRFGAGISYTLAICESGRVFEGTGITRVGAHTAGRNTGSAGIVLVGNYQNKPPTAAQVASLVELLQHGKAAGWWQVAALTGGHRDTKATSCPGDQAYALIPAINAAAQGGAPVAPVANPVPTAPAPAPAPPSRNPRPSGADVRKGDNGPGVVDCQQALARLGFYPADLIDGNAGDITEGAIGAFQFAAFGPPGMDLSYGPASRRAAASVPNYPGPSIPGTTGEDTRAFQRRLQARGYVLADDGSHGPTTTKRMTAFQAEKGLTADGSGGPQTWTALWVRPIT